MKRIGLAALAALLAAGCGGGQLSFSARAGSRTPGGALRSALQVNGGVVIDEVKMVIRRVKLERTASPAGSADSSDTEEVKVGPFLVHLCSDAANAAAPATCPSGLDSGTLSRVFDADVPSDTYKQVKFEIHKVEDADAQANPALASMAGLSVYVRGTASGRAFEFTSSLDEEQEREGSFQVGSGSNNITLSVDPQNWFVDPQTQQPLDPANDKSKIESNIKASIDVYDDDDEDGYAD